LVTLPGVALATQEARASTPSSVTSRHPGSVTLPTGERVELAWSGDIARPVLRTARGVPPIRTVVAGAHVDAIPAVELGRADRARIGRAGAVSVFVLELIDDLVDSEWRNG